MRLVFSAQDGRPARVHILNTPHLLGRILENLAPYGAKDLLSAALVCKKWKQQALDIKWSRCTIRFSRLLEKFDPKVDIKPPYDPDCIATLSIKNAAGVGRERWEQFRSSYAIKVTRLVLDRVLRTKDIAILKQLQVDGQRLCPSLTYLECNPMGNRDSDDEDSNDENSDAEDSDDEDSDAEDSADPEGEVDSEQSIWAENLRFLATPKLLEFSIAQDFSTGRQMNRYIHTITQIAPDIKHLTVYTPEFTPDFDAFKNLRTLSLSGWFDHKGWKLLACCPQLESVELWETGDEYKQPEDPGDEVYTLTLPKLKHFIVEDGEQRNTDFLNALLRNTTMPLLNTVILRDLPEMDNEDTRAYVEKGRSLSQKVRFKFGYGGKASEDDEDD